MTTKKEAADFGRQIGWTIRWSVDWQEFQCFPKGEGVDHPQAYFCSDVDDAVSTVAVMVSRPFTTTEEADLSCDDNHWFLEEDYAVHPSGDHLYAVGDNLYAVFGEDPKYLITTSLKEAMDGVQ